MIKMNEAMRFALAEHLRNPATVSTLREEFSIDPDLLGGPNTGNRAIEALKHLTGLADGTVYEPQYVAKVIFRDMGDDAENHLNAVLEKALTKLGLLEASWAPS